MERPEVTRSQERSTLELKGVKKLSMSTHLQSILGLHGANARVTLRAHSPHENLTDHLVYRESESSGITNGSSTFGGLWSTLSHYFSASAQISFEGYAYAVPTKDSENLGGLLGDGRTGSEAITWVDPIDDMILMLRELTFRISIRTTSPKGYWAWNFTSPQPYILSANLTAIHCTLSQTVNASTSYPATFYHSDFGWFGRALAVIAVAFVAVLANLLGRSRRHPTRHFCNKQPRMLKPQMSFEVLDSKRLGTAL